MKAWIPKIAIASATVLILISAAYAQSFRYIDESGNINWADSISQIPPRYRNQVLAPTPAPTGKVHVKPTPRPTRTPRPTNTPKKTPTPKPTRAPLFPQQQNNNGQNLPSFFNSAKPTEGPAPQLIVPPTPVPNLDSAIVAPK